MPSKGWQQAERGAMSTAPQIAEPAPLKGPQLVEKTSSPLDRWLWLPCTLTVDLRVVNFTVGDLLRLHQGATVETACHQTSDLPLRVNGRLMGWTEFEVVGEQLAVRLTDLA